jgi:FixJ family two-component response regulator
VSEPTSKRIFLIDDDQSIRVALTRLLRASGIEVIAFESADAFLQAEQREADCIISDIRMPGISGLSIPELLAEEGVHLPIIYLTAFDTPETRAQALASGASSYFRKPVDERALLDAIAWAVAKTAIS